MSIRLKIILIILIGSAIILGVFWYIFFYQGQEEAVETSLEQPTGFTNQNLPTSIITNSNANVSLPETTAPAISPVERTKDTLAKMASSFTERFGSYSNQSNYTNFEDLYDFMTDGMRRWAEEMVAELRSQASHGQPIYFGVTTKALSSKLTSFSEPDNQAEAVVNTQRREATGNTSNARIYYQDMVIKFVNEKGIWKIDGSFWQ